MTFDAAEPQKAQSTWRVESDEAAVLRRLCPGASVVIDPDRIAGAHRAMADGCDVLVMDDGFQHRRLHRDLDVVLIDATCPFGYGFMLPRGRLREPRGALRRAHVTVLTHADQVHHAVRHDLLQAIHRLAPRTTLLSARHVVAGWVDVQGRPVAGVDPSAVAAVIFAGIANFDSFRRTVQDLGVKVLAAYAYPDHHDYTNAEIAALPQVAANLEANALLTTEKDAVKLEGRWPDGQRPLLIPRIDIQFEADGAAVLRERLDAALKPRTTA